MAELRRSISELQRWQSCDDRTVGRNAGGSVCVCLPLFLSLLSALPLPLPLLPPASSLCVF
ncbi:hypothetical protein LOK49_Contig25G00023 [Camellia lanceoleosa]|nr:hypothetical protein LOK49_Contig25G00023 [Camellia lanceoleosa]